MQCNLYRHSFHLLAAYITLVLVALGLSVSVLAAEERMVELLVSNTGSSSGSAVVRYDAQTGKFIGQLDDPDADPSIKKYDQPKGLAVDSEGRAYVGYRCLTCDNPGMATILKFSLDTGGRFLTSFASDYGKEEGFEGLAISPDGLDLYVSQRETGQIHRYEIQSGKLVNKLSDFLLPRDLTFDRAGILYVLSQSDKFVGAGQIFGITESGRRFPFVEPEPTGPLQLDDSSAGLTFGPDGDLYVVSTGPDKVLRYRVDNRSQPPRAVFQGEFARPENDRCMDPVGLAFGPHDQNLYVTCRTSNNVVRYDGRTGRFLGEFVRSDDSNRLLSPTYVAFASFALSSSPQLISPPNGEQTYQVTVFRWTKSDNPAVSSYSLEIDTDRDFEVPELELRIKAPQVAVRLKEQLDPFIQYFWRIIALDDSGKPVEQSQQTLSFSFLPTGEITVITGLVKSDLDLAELAGARVAVSSQQHFVSYSESIDENPESAWYIVLALTEINGEPIPFPIEILSTIERFLPTKVFLPVPDPPPETITRNLLMKPIDSDEDGIPDVIESPPSCLKANDADTDDDGIGDGDEDTNKNGYQDQDLGETDPCDPDTDKDGIQDGTELGLTSNDIGSDTDTAVFQPDLDPTTTTNPLDEDSDDDGRLDGQEDANHNGHMDPGETDPNQSERRAIPWILLLLLGD